MDRLGVSCFVLPFLNINVLLFITCQSECNPQTFSKGRRRLLQTYFYKFVKMILKVTIQCNMEETSWNRIP